MNEWVEKILFAVAPLLVSGIIYLFSTVSALQTEINQVRSEAALARQQLKEDVREEVKANAVNIARLEEQVKQLQLERNK